MNIPASHPIFNSAQFHIDTPMIRELRDFVTKGLWCGYPGGYVLGLPRQGKSGGCKGLSKGLQTRAGEEVLVHHVTIAGRDQRTVASIFKNTCLALDMPPKRSATADDMASTLVYYLADSACVNESREVVLVVDEFQRLARQQLGAFSELYDKLNLMGVNLRVFFVGNHAESMELIESINNPSYQHLRERFFIHRHVFNGIRTAEEFKACVDQYDKPLGEYEPISKYVAPEAYADGWRASSAAETIWTVFQEQYAAPLKLTSLGMQYFVTTMLAFLVDYLAKHGVDTDYEKVAIYSLEASGIGSCRISE